MERHEQPQGGRIIGVDVNTRLVTANGTPLVVGSPHHDVVSHVAFDRERMDGVAKRAVLERGDSLREQTPLDLLEHGVDLMERGWQWAEFVLDPDRAKGHTRHNLYATVGARPEAATDAPKTMQGSGGQGNAFVYRLKMDQAPIPSFNDLAIRQPRTERISERREQAQQGRGGRMITRRP